ncbi:hypothetical protein CEXT_599021 [Caerostris extrusa]|uniref:Uncharacterized protein n=1 Tax=Caerostris extrusa TaxID=172846 RepID=A0AAV4SQW8_CAEEX|nr:hypothetical protein CEXT_599021 [Caerostris extrusa]
MKGCLEKDFPLLKFQTIAEGASNSNAVVSIEEQQNHSVSEQRPITLFCHLMKGERFSTRRGFPRLLKETSIQAISRRCGATFEFERVFKLGLVQWPKVPVFRFFK